MTNDNSQDNTGQSGMDSETERRNRENETGEQSRQPPQAGQQQPLEADLQSDTLTTAQTDQSKTSQSGQAQPGQSGSEGGSGFVGSSGDQSSDYLTKGENQDFAPEGQGASDTNAGTADVETGQSTTADATLDDGADTSQ